MDARGQRHNQDSIRPVVTIARVEGDDHHGASSLVRWIHVELFKPDLTAEWSSAGRGHSGALVRKFAKREPTPFGLFLYFAGREGAVVVRDGPFDRHASLLVASCLENFLQN